MKFLFFTVFFYFVLRQDVLVEARPAAETLAASNEEVPALSVNIFGLLKTIVGLILTRDYGKLGLHFSIGAGVDGTNTILTYEPIHAEVIPRMASEGADAVIFVAGKAFAFGRDFVAAAGDTIYALITAISDLINQGVSAVTSFVSGSPAK